MLCLQAVKAAPTTPTSDFIDNKDGTVTHRTTGLTWMRCALGQMWTGLSCSGAASTVFAGDVKLHIPAVDAFTYPDVLVIKDKPDYWQNRRDIVCNAQLIIKVLSDGTQDYGRIGKFEIYRSLPDLQDYILISQDKVHVEHYVKQSSRQWLLTDYNGLTDVLSIAQLGENLAVSDIYDKVDFE